MDGHHLKWFRPDGVSSIRGGWLVTLLIVEIKHKRLSKEGVVLALLRGPTTTMAAGAGGRSSHCT